jgi:orotidine-5'-phosphate decarboxylase
MNNPLIVALDMEAKPLAWEVVRRLGDAVNFYKVGLELFTAEGPSVVRDLVAEGKDVFLDLKMYDIGATVARAAARAALLGARFLTVHSSPQVIRAARQGATGSTMKVLAVTVLTSFDQSDLDELGYTGRTVAEQVEYFVRRGMDAGADGFICSSLEVARLRSLVGPEPLLVVPGVRSAGADRGDQKRVATPAEAMAAGASHLVIGRQVTRAASPRDAALEILTELGSSS